MKRSRLRVAEVAEWPNLLAAFARAARGKRDRAEVAGYAARLDQELETLRLGLLNGDYPLGRMRRFAIRDPKPRIIHAPCFAERVLHHALMAKVGPVLDRALIFDCHACREGKGALAAALRARDQCRRHPWFAQIDVPAYFPSIRHEALLGQLARKFSDHDLMRLFARILAAHEASPGRGLPIGALTSQHFANFHLAAVDRLAAEDPRTGGYVRYMDDMVWWGESRAAVRAALEKMRAGLEGLGLSVKQPVRIGRSREGLSFCGWRVGAEGLRLSRRRKRRYAEARRGAEAEFAAGRIDAAGLQARADAALALTAHAGASAWRAAQLRRAPVVGPAARA